MKSITLKILLLVALTSSGSAAGSASVEASLVQLIANPKQFNGKFVRVIGFLRLEFEGNAIYLHQEDYVHAISKNGIWVNLPLDWPHQKAINNKYVIVEGVFDAKHHGHMGAFSGEISNLKRADLWSDPVNSITAQFARSRKHQ